MEQNHQMSKFRVVFLAVSVAAGYCVWGLLMSLLPPFYPYEAEKKGATPSQYGFVFGIANLTAFIFGPIFGRWGSKVGSKLIYNTGAYVQAICGIGFGLLTYIDDADLFIGLSYLIRALAGIADVATVGALWGILLKLFPQNASSIMSYTEMFFGLGFMIGPAIGSFLYNIGGFKLPMFAVGGLALVTATSLLLAIPNVRTGDNQGETATNPLTFRKMAKSPTILLPYLDMLILAFGYGLPTSSLEPYLLDAGANTTQIGWTFLIFGLVYMFITPFAGYLGDRIPYISLISIVGNVCLVIGFIFIGPLPFIPITTTWTSVTVAFGFCGAGYGLVVVSTFGRAQNAALRLGYQKDMQTNMLISGMWATAYYFGNFIGPTVSGFLVEHHGFRWSTSIFFGGYIVILVLDCLEFVYFFRLNQTRKSAEYEQLE